MNLFLERVSPSFFCAHGILHLFHTNNISVTISCFSACPLIVHVSHAYNNSGATFYLSRYIVPASVYANSTNSNVKGKKECVLYRCMHKHCHMSNPIYWRLFTECPLATKDLPNARSNVAYIKRQTMCRCLCVHTEWRRKKKDRANIKMSPLLNTYRESRVVRSQM